MKTQRLVILGLVAFLLTVAMRTTNGQDTVERWLPPEPSDFLDSVAVERPGAIEPAEPEFSNSFASARVEPPSSLESVVPEPPSPLDSFATEPLDILPALSEIPAAARVCPPSYKTGFRYCETCRCRCVPGRLHLCQSNRSAGFVPPLGTQLWGHLNAQITNGIGARMTLYQYDFGHMRAANAAELNYRGIYELQKIAQRIQLSYSPITIEPSNDPGLDQRRREFVVQQLAVMGYGTNEDQVVVARPTAVGINGEEANIIYQNMLEQTYNRGGMQVTEETSSDGQSSGGAGAAVGSGS